MSGWRNFRTHKSDSFGYKLKRWFHNKSKKMGKENFHFTTRMLMEELELDYDNYGERTKVNNFIYNERKDFSRALTTFLQSEEYLENKEAGKGEKELFDAMVDAALSRNIYPVFCERDDGFNYYFFNFNKFIEFRKARLQSVEKQLKGESELYESLEEAIPRIGDHISPARLEIQAPGLLPEPTVETCPICEQKYRGTSPADLLIAHIKKEHAPSEEEIKSIESFPCPTCGAPAHVKLHKELRFGEFRCRECKNTHSEKEIRGSSG